MFIVGAVLVVATLGFHCQANVRKEAESRHKAQAACVQAGNAPHECERLK